LGGCINNIGDVSKCVKTIIGVKAQIEDSRKIVDDIIGNPDSGMQTFRKLFNPIDAARVITEKIIEGTIN
jgi:hypothetical protein